MSNGGIVWYRVNNFQFGKEFRNGNNTSAKYADLSNSDILPLNSTQPPNSISVPLFYSFEGDHMTPKEKKKSREKPEFLKIHNYLMIYFV